MGTLFISYRRDDTQGFAGRLEDDLSEHFGDALVFRDREIPAGTDFAAHLERHLAEAEVVLVVIGPNWLAARNAAGDRRLELPQDWVRREIMLALATDVPVVPVLVGGATMPAASDLPSALAPLAGRQAFILSDQRWPRELDDLADQMARLSPALAAARHARRRNSAPPPARATPSTPSVAARLLPWLGRRVGKLVSALVTLSALYILLRALGGPQANRMLDKVIATTLAQIKTLM